MIQFFGIDFFKISIAINKFSVMLISHDAVSQCSNRWNVTVKRKAVKTPHSTIQPPPPPIPLYKLPSSCTSLINSLFPP